MTTPFTALPNTLYSIPKAQILFKPQGSAAYELLGDTDEVTIEPTVEETERFTNEDGVRTKVRTVVTQVDAVLSMTLMQLTDRNRALSLLGELTYYTQAAQVGQTFNAVDVAAGLIFQLPDVYINPVGITVESTDVVPVAYVLGTNYKIDTVTGLLEIVAVPGGANDEIDVTYDTLAITALDKKAKIGLASKTENRGSIIIRGTNEVGPRVQVVLHDVQLRPAGARNFISETDFDGIEIEGAIFRDPTQAAGLELGYEFRLDQ